MDKKYWMVNTEDDIFDPIELSDESRVNFIIGIANYAQKKLLEKQWRMLIGGEWRSPQPLTKEVIEDMLREFDIIEINSHQPVR
jgi:hypothetical protein